MVPGCAIRDREDEDGFYTYREFAQSFPRYIKEMGYTHVELMGIAEHPFDGSWGYQVTGYYAPTSRYGTPKISNIWSIIFIKIRSVSFLTGYRHIFPKDAHGLADFDGTAVRMSMQIQDRENIRTGEQRSLIMAR